MLLRRSMPFRYFSAYTLLYRSSIIMRGAGQAYLLKQQWKFRLNRALHVITLQRSSQQYSQGSTAARVEQSKVLPSLGMDYS